MSGTALFHNDWFTTNQWQFERHLAPLAGTPCRLLEIGCNEGRSTCWLLDHILTHPDARLISIDPTPQPNFRSNVATRSNWRQVELRVGASRDVLPGLEPSSFDFIYVDGCHATIEVLEDAVLSFRLAKVGGVIGFDDYKYRDPTYRAAGYPKPAIDAFLDIYRPKLKRLAKNYQVWVRKLAD